MILQHTQFHPLLLPGVGSPVLVLPFVIELAVLTRGLYTRKSTDIVLAAVAVPCLVVSTWATVEGLNPSGGVYWGEVFSIIAGGILTLFVVIDCIIGSAVKARASG
ncbi:hypothetical protein SAMN05216226_11582 [Halovenus aranensis]|jgi:hypothetical protein|uniref:Uncharacterized protein n=1 Tax=Halovenus aranensis TaxID=890420 RepID=A0A1G8YP22_9EURY|nr:hypothetical protein [Halovenus aranensis]SDK04602.1 hypothetical protein SAMN05216226_11582 [Halovenus aranensis]